MQEQKGNNTDDVGMTQMVRLNRQATHLVCKLPEGLKYVKAQEWGVQRVTEEWLYNVARTGEIGVEDDYRHVARDGEVNGIGGQAEGKIEVIGDEGDKSESSVE